MGENRPLKNGLEWEKSAAQPRTEQSGVSRREAATNFPLGKFGLRPLGWAVIGVGTVLLDGAVCGVR